MNNSCAFSAGSRNRPALWRRWSLVILALTGLGLTGCQSFNMCGGRGLCGSAQPSGFKRLGQRIFNRQPAPAVMACEPGLIGAPISDSCGPAYSSGGSMISPGSISGEEAPPLDLSPISPTGGVISGTGTGTSTGSGLPPEAPQGFRVPSGADKAVYKSFKPSGGSPSARREPTGLSLTTEPARSVDPLANLPSLNPPTELTNAAIPTEVDLKPKTSVGTKPSNVVSPSDLIGSASAGAVSMAPGIRSFKNLEPKLSGGSLPNDAGWAWLFDNGYKTVLDLRPKAEVKSSDLAAINAIGLRRVELPVESDQIDKPEILAQFAAEIAKDPARPIYFFDTDGSRASVLWYLHMVAYQNASPESAKRTAGDIGPKNSVFWSKATAAIPAARAAATLKNTDLPPNPGSDTNEFPQTSTHPA